MLYSHFSLFYFLKRVNESLLQRARKLYIQFTKERKRKSLALDCSTVIRDDQGVIERVLLS